MRSAIVRPLGAAVAALAIGTSVYAGVHYGTGGGGTFPLQVSANGRYLQTNGGSPFLLIGDSPQSTIGDLTVTNANTFLDDRAAHGFNAVWINLLCADYTYCNVNGTAQGDGGGAIAPFTSGSSPSNYDPGTNCANCNTAYFSRAHDIIAHAQSAGLAVFLDPIPTDGCQAGGWIDLIDNMGDNTISTTTKGYQYGVWLGNYFKDLDNIIWMSGNDWWPGCQTSSGNNVVSIAMGIASTDPSALQTVELECNDATCAGSTALDNTTFTSNMTMGVNTAYQYSPTYANTRRAYAQSPTTPMVMIEASYEGEQNGGTDGCITIRNCRLQEWWTATSGQAGQLYGCHCTTHLANSDFPLGSNVDTTAVTQLGYVSALLSGKAWYDLAPDANGSGHLIPTGGGSCPATGLFASLTCITAAQTSDQSMALIYAPGPSSDQTFSVDFSKMAGTTTTARWYDPTNGSFTTVTGSPFTNSGGAQSITAGNNAANSAGDHDWALLLEGS